MESDKIVGIILAAGYSSRMGGFKPLLPIGDITAIERVLASLRKAGVETVIGVTGFQRERLSSIFAAKGIQEAYNPDFDHGMFTSIKTGITKALSIMDEPPEGFFLLPVDCPLVPSEVIEQIMEKHKEKPQSFIVPCYRGKKGHPLFIPAIYGSEILAYDGEGGLKAVTSRYEDRLIRLEADTEAVVLDMDTPEGYHEILDYLQKQANGFSDDRVSDLEKALRGRRLFLVRHGEIRQHKEKIFLGQADVPLSDRGKEQAAEAAKVLAAYGIKTDSIFSSDLSRAAETAEIIKVGLDRKIEIITDQSLREMALGEWDGRYISEVRERYPEDYRKRGEDPLSHKFGNGSENYYDLQYRVLKGLEKLLKSEKDKTNGEDIILVTHAGVIRVLLSALLGTKLEDEIKNRPANGGVIMIDYSDMNTIDYSDAKEKQK